ncbi:MAG: hypothetical protein R3F16_16985 [Myxococcota bacterium]
MTWVPNIAEALALPRVHFDGVLLETEDGEHSRSRFRGWRRRCRRR